MADLSNLFNSPPSAPPPVDYAPRSPSASPGPSRHRDLPSTEALFLSPGSALDSPRPVGRTRPRADSEPGSPSRPSLGQAAAQKRTDAPYPDWLDEPATTPPGSMPMGPSGQGGYGAGDNAPEPYTRNGVYDPLAGLGGGAVGGDGDAGDAPTGKKRVLPKIDAERLMGENGFPALMKAAKRFKVHGKGFEVGPSQDLKALLNIYQLWAHTMFPKGDFVYTIGRVEKVCRTRRMESALSGYREAFNPPPRSPTPPPRSPGGITPPPEDESYDRGAGGAGGDAGADDDGDMPSDRSSQPLFTPGDEPDYDELIAMEEAEREEAAARQADSVDVARSKPAAARTDGADNGPVMLEEEDEWEGLYN